MALAPERWSSIAEDERLQPLLTPFIGFLDVTDPDFEPADNIDELLDESNRYPTLNYCPAQDRSVQHGVRRPQAQQNRPQ
jgi:hypothetical protein